MFDLYQRNIGILMKEQQDHLAHSHLLILGCGMGSLIAELAVRTGFGKITIMDGDTVALSNLNRQNYVLADQGIKKVEAISQRLKAINPDVDLTIIPEFLSFKNWDEKLLLSADVVIDTMDISAIDIILAVHRLMRKNKRTVVFPLNMAFGSGLFVFSPVSATLEELMGMEPNISAEEAHNLYQDKRLFEPWVKLLRPHLLPYMTTILDSFLKKVLEVGWCPAPQIGIASHQSASLAVTAALKVVLGLPVPAAPRMARLDAWHALE